MPVTRSATLRVAHARSCPNASRTTLDSGGKAAGCDCKPSYFTLHRDSTGRPVKGPRVKDRKVADAALRKLLVAIDEQRVGVGRPHRQALTFRAWADEYLEHLERDRRNKASTTRAYRSTLGYADPIFGTRPLVEIGAAELRRFVRAIRDAKSGDATLHKHLRHLAAILRAAEEEGHIERSPLTRKFTRDLRLRVPKGDEAYTDAELARLWAKMATLEYEPVYVLACKLAVTTGARQGELIAATWGDLNLGARTLAISHHWDRLDGLVAPKDRDPRVVNLIAPAVALLEAHVAAEGVRPDDAPILQAPRSGEHLNGQYLTKLVAAAAKAAGLPELGEGGRKRKPFHSFRATYARLCLEAGRDPQWVQKQLGHSDVSLTVGVYGRRSDSFDRAEADAIEAAAFPI